MGYVLEWLFPIRRYVRKRIQVRAFAAVATFVLALLILLALDLGPFLSGITADRVAGYSARTQFYPAVLDVDLLFRLLRTSTTDGLTEVRGRFADVKRLCGEIGLTKRSWGRSYRLALPFPWGPSRWAIAARHGRFVAAVIGGLLGIEFVLALVFVRHRPGRRRPLCTWQTFKYTLLGSRSWAILALVYVGVALALYGTRVAWALDGLSSLIWQGTLIALLVGVPVAMVGGIAAQAAAAVVVLQDDRRCPKCDYFLIGLTQPRCPECGTPFDPAKLGTLAATAEEGSD